MFENRKIRRKQEVDQTYWEFRQDSKKEWREKKAKSRWKGYFAGQKRTKKISETKI